MMVRDRYPVTMISKLRTFASAIPILSGLLFALPVSATTVPFLSQSPFGEWRDLRQEQGCEEAASLMAVAWAQNKTIAPLKGRNQIIAISNWEKTNWGYYQDTSIADTADRIIRQYLGYNKIEVRNIVSTYDIQDALRFGNILLVAINGRKIASPYYRHPAPLHHMILLIGYDEKNDAFIANDPGTWHGAGERISREHLQNALQDYPSGDGTARTALPPAMIVIGK